MLSGVLHGGPSNWETNAVTQNNIATSFHNNDVQNAILHVHATLRFDAQHFPQTEMANADLFLPELAKTLIEKHTMKPSLETWAIQRNFARTKHRHFWHYRNGKRFYRFQVRKSTVGDKTFLNCHEQTPSAQTWQVFLCSVVTHFRIRHDRQRKSSCTVV